MIAVTQRETESPETPPGDTTTARRGGRLLSLDATRGWAIVILLLAGNPFQREYLWDQFKHPQWHGLRFADLFFPLFLFVIGVAMTMSRRSDSPRQVLRRVALLFMVGVALASLKHEGFHVTGVLQHIAGAYLIAWLVLRAPRKTHVPIAAGILAAVWAASVLVADGDPWGLQGTLAHAVDGFIYGHFVTEGTVQTVTSAVTVIGGAMIGRGLRERREPERLLRWVAGHAAWLTGAGLLLGFVIPINKRLWTPSFTLLTLGVACAWFALFILLIDVRRRTPRWVTPIVELGANPIAIYIGYITLRALIDDYKTAAPHIAPLGSDAAGAMIYSIAWLVLGWAFAHLLYRRRLFLKI